MLFSGILFIVSRLLTRAISNLALQAIEKVPDVSRNSASWGYADLSTGIFDCSDLGV